MFVIGRVTISGCQNTPFGAGSRAVWKASWPHQLEGERGAKFHARLKSQVSNGNVAETGYDSCQHLSKKQVVSRPRSTKFSRMRYEAVGFGLEALRMQHCVVVRDRLKMDLTDDNDD